jgi:hypothetical protein
MTLEAKAGAVCYRTKTVSSEKSQSHVELEKFFLRLVTNARERRSDFQSGHRCINHDPTSPSGYLQ